MGALDQHPHNTHAHTHTTELWTCNYPQQFLKQPVKRIMIELEPVLILLRTLWWWSLHCWGSTCRGFFHHILRFEISGNPIIPITIWQIIIIVVVIISSPKGSCSEQTGSSSSSSPDFFLEGFFMGFWLFLVSGHVDEDSEAATRPGKVWWGSSWEALPPGNWRPIRQTSQKILHNVDSW